MKIIIAPDSFKGTLSSAEICSIIEQELSKRIACDTVSIPIADGGEGTLDVFAEVYSNTSQMILAPAADAWMRPISAPYLLVDPDTEHCTAIIEMAKVAGFSSEEISPGKSGAMYASTYGVGMLICDAISKGARKCLIGLGGSCTSDGGCGMAAALGVRFFRHDSKDDFIPTGATLSQISAIDPSKAAALLGDVQITGLCDVRNPLHGKHGAAYIFGPQKGASPADVELIDSGLKNLASFYDADISGLPGAGAAGGLGFGICAFAGGDLERGIDSILSSADFASHLNDASLVITGEGHFDSQSFDGKVVSGISSAAAAAGLPVIVICGFTDKMKKARLDQLGIVEVFETGRFSMSALSPSQAHSLAVFQLKETLVDVARYIKCQL